MQIKSLPFRMEQRSEHLGSTTRGQNKEREVVNVRKGSLSGPNSTATFPLTTFQQLVCNYRKHKPLYLPHTNAKFVLGTDWSRQAAISDIYHCLQASGNLSLSLPLTRHTPFYELTAPIFSETSPQDSLKGWMFTTTLLWSTRQEMNPSHNFPVTSVFLLNKHALSHVMTLSQQQEHIQRPSQKPLSCTSSILGHMLH